MALVLKQFGILPIEYFFEISPIFRILKSGKYYEFFKLFIFQMGVANNNPDKKPELIFEPIRALHVIAIFVKPKSGETVLGINRIVKFQGLIGGNLRNVICLDVIV